MLESHTLVASRDVLVKSPNDYKSAVTPEHRPVIHCKVINVQNYHTKGIQKETTYDIATSRHPE
jgi:hypothetical protein